MVVKTITITEEAYRILTIEKREGESFSEAIKRLASEKCSLRNSLGAWKMSGHEEREIFSNLRSDWKRTSAKLRESATGNRRLCRTPGMPVEKMVIGKLLIS